MASPLLGLLGGDAALGPMASPLLGRAVLRSRRGRQGEEAGAGRLPQPSLKDWTHRGASRICPHCANVKSCPVGFSVVLPAQRWWALPQLHRAADQGAPRQLELWCHQDTLGMAPSRSRCSELSAQGRFDRRPHPLRNQLSTGTSVDVSTAEDARDGSLRSVAGSRGVPHVKRSAPRWGGGYQG